MSKSELIQLFIFNRKARMSVAIASDIRACYVCYFELSNSGKDSKSVSAMCGYLRRNRRMKAYPPKTWRSMPGIPMRKSWMARYKSPFKAHSPSVPTT